MTTLEMHAFSEQCKETQLNEFRLKCSRHRKKNKEFIHLLIFFFPPFGTNHARRIDINPCSRTAPSTGAEVPRAPRNMLQATRELS